MSNIDTIREALKPCPFCGGKAHIHNIVGGIWWYACGQCKAETMASSSKSDAFEIWNQRAPSAIDTEAKTQEPSKNAVFEATGLALAISKVETIRPQIKLILAHDDAIRRECVAKMRTEILADSDCDFNRMLAGVVEAAILGTEPAREGKE